MDMQNVIYAVVVLFVMGVLFAILLCVTLYQWHHNKNND